MFLPKCYIKIVEEGSFTAWCAGSLDGVEENGNVSDQVTKRCGKERENIGFK